MGKSNDRQVFKPLKNLKRRENKLENNDRKPLRDVFTEEEDFDLWNTEKEDEEHEYWESFTQENDREPEGSGVSRTEESVSGDSTGEGSKSGLE